MSGKQVREGSYQLPDGRTVSFTDAETLRDVADLWAIVQGEYNGTPSATSDALKNMLGELQGGKPLSEMEWSMLQRIQRKYDTKLQQFRSSGDNLLEGYVPVPDVGAGRISEAFVALPPSQQERILRESYKTESTTPKDRNTTTPHLLDTALHDLAHAKQHADRLNAADVRADSNSLDFNVEHMAKHLESARDHISRLGKHLAQHPSNPKTFEVERATLHKLREIGATTTPAVPSEPTICVDFDGVLHQGPHGLPGKVEGTVIKGAPAALKALAKRFRVVVLTARVDIAAVQNWLQEQGLAEYITEVTNRKPAASAYIDDRATHFTDWKSVMPAVDPDIQVSETPVATKHHAEAVPQLKDGKQVRESSPSPPPNLRPAPPHHEDAVLGAATPQHECCTCTMFDKGRCWGYGDFPVDADWICDSWDASPNWRNQVSQNRIRKALAQDSPSIMLREAQTDPLLLLHYLQAQP